MLETPSTNPALRAVYAKAHRERALVFLAVLRWLIGRNPGAEIKSGATPCNC